MRQKSNPRKALVTHRKTEKKGLKLIIPAPKPLDLDSYRYEPISKRPRVRKFAKMETIDEEPPKLQRQDALLSASEFPQPPPPPPPPPPSPEAGNRNSLSDFRAARQDQLPFQLTPGHTRYGLVQVSTWLCAACLNESKTRIAIRHLPSNRTYMSLSLCETCFRCNSALQTAANAVWFRQNLESVNEKKEKEQSSVPNVAAHDTYHDPTRVNKSPAAAALSDPGACNSFSAEGRKTVT